MKVPKEKLGIPVMLPGIPHLLLVLYIAHGTVHILLHDMVLYNRYCYYDLDCNTNYACAMI